MGYNAALWAMERQCRELNESVSAQIKVLRGEVERELGFAAKLNARALGPLLLWTYAARGTAVGERKNV